MHVPCSLRGRVQFLMGSEPYDVQQTRYTVGIRHIQDTWGARTLLRLLSERRADRLWHH